MNLSANAVCLFLAIATPVIYGVEIANVGTSVAALNSSVAKADDGTDPRVAKLVAAIAGQESNHNPNAVNPHSGALGKGQVMPDNVADWTQECLGSPMTTDEFIQDPAAQRQVMTCKLGQYFQQAIKDANGDEKIAVRRVASAWYSGDPDLYDNGNPQKYDGHDYPSIRDYTLEVLNRYEEQKQ